MAQLSQQAATLVASFLVMTPDDQALVFNTLAKHQPPQMFAPYSTLFSTPPPTPPAPTFRTSVPFDTTPASSVWDNKQVLEQVVKKEPIVYQRNGKKREKKEQQQQHKEKPLVLLEPEPITDTCIQVCDQEGCACRYKFNEGDHVPDLVLEGVYIYLGHQHQDIPRKEGENKSDRSYRISNIFYARIAKSLPFLQLQEGQLYITHNRTEAQLRLHTHEDAANAYTHLRTHGFRVNWMRVRQARTKKDQEEDEENSGVSQENE